MIATERLVLRPPDKGDLPFVLSAINTPQMMRYLGGAVRSPAEIEQGIDADIAAFASGAWRRWTVFRRADGQPLGRVGLFTVRSPPAPAQLAGQNEIGWMLATAHQGQGYASEAARAVLAQGFTAFGFPVIYSQTSDSNGESTRMMTRLGFARAAGLDYVDPDYPPADNPTTVYRLTRDQWSAGA